MSSAWDGTYSAKAEHERSWTESCPLGSLAAIAATGVTPGAAIVDIGGGASRLVDELLARGHTDITVLDISLAALGEARRRVERSSGDSAGVHWIAADVTTWRPDRAYAVWHDRAVFHFLVQPHEQSAYVRAATEVIAPGGHLIIAAFAPSGPDTCSGLPVARWSAEQLQALFAGAFEPVASSEDAHVTPWGATQPFTWIRMRRTAVS